MSGLSKYLEACLPAAHVGPAPNKKKLLETGLHPRPLLNQLT
jgi:hypothetical protein